jgi:uncharacterized protein
MKALLHGYPFIILIYLFLSGCSTSPEMAGNEYVQSLAARDSMRLVSLKSPTGWLNLAGLFWLKEGENTLGSDEENDIVFPRGPKRIGIIRLKEGVPHFLSSEKTIVRLGENPVSDTLLVRDDQGKPSLLETDSLGFYVIKRGDRYGIRLRDYTHPAIQSLQKIERFPPDESWIIRARFIRDTSGRTISIPDVLGEVKDEKIPGTLEFEFSGKTYTLYPTGTREKLFLVFGDETNAMETYGAGRFLGLEPPDSLDFVDIDFNKAYNPPCAFSPFATCPLPPRENLLPFRVTAGEKAVPYLPH